MTDTADDVAKRAKALPRAELESLVDELLVSLHEAGEPALNEAWNAEIERRVAAYDRGEVQAIPAEEVLARARALAK